MAPRSLAYEKPLCASLDGFTLHAATHAGAANLAGREALLRCVLRPPIAQGRIEAKSDGLVRLTLKRAYADGTVAVDMDPLSLLSRLAASVPPPRYHTVKYAGVLASASKLRARIRPRPPHTSTQPDAADDAPVERPPPRSTNGLPSVGGIVLVLGGRELMRARSLLPEARTPAYLTVW